MQVRAFFPLMFLFAGAFFEQLCAQTRYYVDADAVGWQTGMNWDDAFRSLHEALAVAVRGDQIWVAEGIYYPSATGDRSEAFEMYGGIKLYGGFVGGESDLSQRDWEAHPTVLSGDIGMTDYKWDNSFNLLKVYESDISTVIDGLIFRDAYMGEGEGPCYQGKVVGDFYHNVNSFCGGALYVESAGTAVGGGLVLSRCRFEGNAGLSGAGMTLLTLEQTENIVIEHCSFVENDYTFSDWIAYGPPVGGQGSGVYICGGLVDGGTISVSNSIFLSNRASISGGGLCFVSNHQGKIGDYLLSMSLSVDSCQFIGNSAEYFGGGLHTELYKDTDVKVANSRFLNNSAGMGEFMYEFCNECSGGAMNIYISNIAPYDFEGTLLLENSVFSNNRAHVAAAFFLWTMGESLVRNNLFEQNEVSEYASLAYTYGTPYMFWRSNTFVENVSAYYIGLFGSYSSHDYFDFSNNVFWGNVAGDDAPFFMVSNDTLRLFNNIFGEVDSCVELSAGFQSTLLCDSSNAFGIAPGFVNAAGGDYHPAYCSPLIDGGSVEGIEAGETDLDGLPRVVNLPDIGAYESTGYSPEVVSEGVNCYGDGNGSIDVQPASFGPPPYVFMWSTGDTTSSLENLGPGLYEITITDANDCTQYAAVEIEEPLPVEGFYSVLPASSSDASDGAVLQDSISGGTPPYFYFWDTGAQTPSLEEVPPGDYMLTILDEHGCWQELDFEVSFVSAVEAWEHSRGFLLYPNPSSGESYLLWDGAFEKARAWHFVLYDLSGRLVFEQELWSKTGYARLSLSHLPKGSYVYELSGEAAILTRGQLSLF